MKLKEIFNKIKNSKYKKEIITIIVIVFLITVVVTLRGTHAYYNYESAWTPIFTGKVGNFVKQESKPVLDMLKETGGDVFAGGGDHTTVVDGLYRYKGTYEEVTNNYICLGDENPDVCKTNKDHMYRIIGVTTEGNLKVIKASKSSSQQWFSSYNDSRKWNESVAYTYLNGTFYNSIDKRIKGLIEKHTWNMEYTQSISGTTTGRQDGTVSNYIGLMYGSDYVNAYKDGTKGNWLFIQNGLTGNTAETEWTMSRYGYNGYYYTAWAVYTSGALYSDYVYNSRAVRPVFYLTSNIELSGKGTEENPFVVVPEKPKPVLDKLEATTSEQYLKTVADNDELLRYVGTYKEVTNNFICFGTDDKDKCTSEPETYMYRIIGITTENVNRDLGLEKNQLKIIKAEPNSDGKSVAWNSDYSSDIPWDSADVQKTYLNGTFLNSITGITTKVGTHNWSDLITSEKWYKGDNTSGNSSKTEVKTLTTGSYKVGLMYASDYYNSWTYGSNTNSWLHITNGMSGSTSANEWTMTRYGNDYGLYFAWYVYYSNGDLNYYGGVNNPYAVRPVFYLTNEISISGAGTESDPFIISDKIVS